MALKKKIPPKKVTKVKKKAPKRKVTTHKEPLKHGRPIEWTPERIENERLALEEWIENPKNYFFTAFLNERKLGPEQVERFSRNNESFCETYARAKRIQEQRIVDGAMNRKFDATFAKFVLQNRAGWKEKQEVSGDAANPLAVIMERIGQSATDPLDTLFGD